MLAQHLADLHKSGIDEAAAEQYGFSSVNDPKRIVQLLNWDKKAERYAKELGPCLLIRYYDAQGNPTPHKRLKPDIPRVDKYGKVSKYLGPKGKPNQIYFPKGITSALENPSTTILITEGEKKAVCAHINGFACIGLAGVECWSKPREKEVNGKKRERELVDALASIHWSHRTVYIVFDSDRIDKPEVRKAEFALAQALSRGGAMVKVVQLPAGPPNAEGNATKQGLDDYLVREGAEPFQSLLVEAVDPESLDKNLLDETGGLVNYFLEKEEQQDPADEKERVKVIPKPLKLIMSDCLTKTKGWPKRVGNQLFAVKNHKPQFLCNTHELFAYLGCNLPRRVLEPKAHPIDWKAGSGFVTPPQYYAALQQSAEAFDAVEAYPHEPPLPNHFYVHPPVGGGDGSALFGLLSRFSPATMEDADLLLAFLLSLVCGVPCGQRPAWLITASDSDDQAGRGVGKTTLVRVAASLVGGFVSYNAQETLHEFVKRLLSPDGRDKRVVLIDNIKSHKFSSSDLESLITCDTISGRQMFVGEGRRPNTITWCMTINGASLSKDLAQRLITIQLRRPQYVGAWESETISYVQEHRWAILGDLVACLQQPCQPLPTVSRWGHWEQVVLARLHDPARLQQVIRERQGAIDDDEEDKDLVREAICLQMKQQGFDAEAAYVFFSSKRMAAIINEALQEDLPVNRASSFLKTLGINELRKSDRGTMRGWLWKGKHAQNGSPVMLG